MPVDNGHFDGWAVTLADPKKSEISHVNQESFLNCLVPIVDSMKYLIKMQVKMIFAKNHFIKFSNIYDFMNAFSFNFLLV